MFNAFQSNPSTRKFVNFCEVAASVRQEEERATKAKQLGKEIKTIEKSMIKLLKKAETKTNPTKIRRQLDDLKGDLIKAQKKQAKLSKEQSEASAPVDVPVDPLSDLVALAARLDGKTVEEDKAEIETIRTEVAMYSNFLHAMGHQEEAAAYYDDAHNKVDLLEDNYIGQRLERAVKSDEVPLETVSIADLNPKVVVYDAEAGKAMGAMAEAMIRSGAAKAP